MGHGPGPKGPWDPARSRPWPMALWVPGAGPMGPFWATPQLATIAYISLRCKLPSIINFDYVF